eukprot:m.19284 g.19284  ORF g.19284 m.19284 type:complete len:752 (+) comp8009_c0_seq2:76-2331(+)
MVGFFLWRFDILTPPQLQTARQRLVGMQVSHVYMCAALMLLLRPLTASHERAQHHQHHDQQASYLVYCPAVGRLGNQVDHLLGALHLASQSGRTLIVPDFVNHKAHSSDLSLGHLFDVDWLLHKRDVIPLSQFQAEGRTLSEVPLVCNTPNTPDVCQRFWNRHGVTFGKVIFGPEDEGHGHGLTKWLSLVSHHSVLAFCTSPLSFPAPIASWTHQVALRFSYTVEKTVRKAVSNRFNTPCNDLSEITTMHFRTGSEWITSCRFDASDILQQQGRFMASDQCTYSDIDQACFQNVADIIRAIETAPTQCIYIATDCPECAQHAAALYAQQTGPKTVARTVIVGGEDIAVDLGMMALSAHFIANCFSTLSALAIRHRLLFPLDYQHTNNARGFSFFAANPAPSLLALGHQEGNNDILSVSNHATLGSKQPVLPDVATLDRQRIGVCPEADRDSGNRACDTSVTLDTSTLDKSDMASATGTIDLVDEYNEYLFDDGYGDDVDHGVTMDYEFGENAEGYGSQCAFQSGLQDAVEAILVECVTLTVRATDSSGSIHSIDVIAADQLATLDLTGVKHVTSRLRITDSDIKFIIAPDLQSIGRFDVRDCPQLNTIHLPLLLVSSDILVMNNQNLVSVTFPTLSAVTSLTLYRLPLLETANLFDLLKFDHVHVAFCPVLQQLNMPKVLEVVHAELQKANEMKLENKLNRGTQQASSDNTLTSLSNAVYPYLIDFNHVPSSLCNSLKQLEFPLVLRCTST